MTKRELASLRKRYQDCVATAAKRIGGRGGIEEIDAAAAALFVATYSHAELDELVGAMRRDLTRKMLNTKGADGLPFALKVESAEQYVIRSVMSPDEYREVTGQYASRAKANIGAARKLADECFAVHGVVIDVAAFFDGHYGVSA